MLWSYYSWGFIIYFLVSHYGCFVSRLFFPHTHHSCLFFHYSLLVSSLVLSCRLLPLSASTLVFHHFSYSSLILYHFLYSVLLFLIISHIHFFVQHHFLPSSLWFCIISHILLSCFWSFLTFSSFVTHHL